MSIRRVKVNGRKMWQARVAYRGLRKSTIRESKEDAKMAEGELRSALQAQAAQAEVAGQRPATLKALLEFYAEDMAARGKGEESVGRVEYTALAVERLCPEMLTKPLGDLREAEHDQPRLADTARRAQEGAARVPLPLRCLLQGRRDPRPLAPARGGVDRPRADALAGPRNCQARGAHADALDRGAAAPMGHGARRAGRDPAPGGQGGRAAGGPERCRPEDPPGAARRTPG